MQSKKIFISPSILSADFANLGKEIEALTRANADYIHIDVMDGHFVPNITIGPDIVKAIRPYSNLIFDVHLMIEKPENFVEKFASSGADIITIHAESTIHIDRTLSIIKEHGKKAGISLVPSTSPDILDYIMDKIDLILIMSVNPGFGGQKFMESQIKKIEIVRDKINKSMKNIDLQVDGGISLENSKRVIDAGANILVAGSYIFKDGPEFYASNIEDLRNGSKKL